MCNFSYCLAVNVSSEFDKLSWTILYVNGCSNCRGHSEVIRKCDPGPVANSKQSLFSATLTRAKGSLSKMKWSNQGSPFQPQGCLAPRPKTLLTQSAKKREKKRHISKRKTLTSLSCLYRHLNYTVNSSPSEGDTLTNGNTDKGPIKVRKYYVNYFTTCFFRCTTYDRKIVISL